MTNEITIIPDDQQEDEGDIDKHISFKDAVVLNADWTIETINSQIQKGNIDLQPGFQRRVAWDDVRKSRLIESIIVSLPVPNIVLAENRNHRGRFIVIDGKQRLVSISNFMANGFTLRGLDIRPDLNSRSFEHLPSEDRECMENATLRSTLIRNWTDENFLYATFFRLNSGSLPLSPQELRKALVGSNLLDAIDEYLLASEAFKRIFGNELDKRMRDSELVLRFLAFDRSLTDYRGDFKEFLDSTTRYFEDDWTTRQAEASEALARFDMALNSAHSIFGADSFKKWIGDKYERVINRAVFDCVVRFFAIQAVVDASNGKGSEIVDAFKTACLDRDFREAIEKTTKSVHATFHRIDRWGEVLSASIGLSYDKAIHQIV